MEAYIKPGEMNATTRNIYLETCYVLKEKVEVIIKFPSTWNVLLYVIALLVNVSLFFTTLLLNGVTVATIWNSHKLKEIASNFAILIQSIVDLAYGLIVIPLSVMIIVRNLVGSPSCTTVYTCRKLASLLYIFSMTTMSMMSFERYMGVLYPFVHRVQVTIARLLKFIITVCCLQAFLYGVTFFNGVHFCQMTRPFFVTNMLLFLAFTAFAYTRIFRSIIKKSRFPPGQQVVHVAERTNISTKRRLLKEFKIAKSCFLVVVTSIVCFLPSLILFGVLSLETNFLVHTLKNCMVIHFKCVQFNCELSDIFLA